VQKLTAYSTAHFVEPQTTQS